MLTINSITLDHYFVNNRLFHGYIGYQKLVGAVNSTTIGEYRKTMNHKGTEKTTTEVNTVNITSVKNIRRDSTYFYKWSEDISTILSQETSAGGYTALRYLVWEDGADKICNTDDPNLPDPPK